MRLLVVDDHPVVRRGLRALLDSSEVAEVVGEASDGEEAVAAHARLRPDVTLMDLVLPRVGGIEALRRIRADDPAARVLVLTSFASEDQVLPAIEAGAAGYLLKDAPPGELEAAVAAVAAGEGWLDRRVAPRVMGHAVGRADRRGLARLTPREREVLTLIARGRSNRAIAAELVVSEKTVKTHVSHLLGKLDLADRTQAALLGARHGLADP